MFIVVFKGLEDLSDYGFDFFGGNDFEGGGGFQVENIFIGIIMVMVLEVLINGNFCVCGEKQILINQGIEFICFFGVVDLLEIFDINMVLFIQVVDVCIEYVGDGYINEVQYMGWLQCFFLNILLF